MKRLVLALTMTTVAIGLLAVDANAAGGPFPRWRGLVQPSQPAAAYPAARGGFRAFPGYSPYQSVEDAYPRYTGAFHSRYFNDIGIPSGDVGFRGNTLYMLPW